MERKKGIIKQVGEVVTLVSDSGIAYHTKGWLFDCKNDPEIPAIGIEDNEVYYAGYSIPELIEISQTKQ